MSTSFKPDESRRASSKDGDWICPDADCKNLNFARRSQCNRCGGDRPYGSEKSSSSSTGTANDSLPSTGSKKKVGIEIGKVAAEKSRGLFSAEDWQCSKCANVNWARRHTCNLCSAPRFCEVEERTGYGGGYNDRGVVEYKDRSESDDDYDEFGRRKKKRSSSNSRYRSTSENASKKLHNKQRNDEEEDDDDDDDDSGDLSKYDLWGSDTEDNRKSVKQSETNHRKRQQSLSSRSSSSYSRSRSRSPRGHSDYYRDRQNHYRRKRSRSRSNSPRNKHHSSSSYRR